ncbi:AbiTii domain-containing protein [Castellaniella caeni]|uniref:AbiTii domain-containing protein n=1 Tax=Castellaniella caeni TaxID=266123 RepID=UPI001CA5948F|nr:hypothetical protein [Castellaniella caeni]
MGTQKDNIKILVDPPVQQHHRSKMAALVPELVNMASEPHISTADLLRKALVVARRLAVQELVTWINSELNGYNDSEVPEYRKVVGQLHAENPYRGGTVPFIVPQEIAEIVTLIPLAQPLPELQQLAKSDTLLLRYFPADMEQILMNMMMEGSGSATRPLVKFTPIQIGGVVDRVRSRILDWALDLEDRGIIGEGMSFTLEEKQAVQEQHYHFGNVSGSQIQISSNGSTQAQTNTNSGHDLEAVKGLIDALGAILERGVVPDDAVDEMRAELATLKAQAASPKPKWEIIKATARTIKTIAEGVAGNILGELAKPHVVTLLALAAGA